MSIDINIHAAHDGGLKLAFEFPSNSGAITLEEPRGSQITLYLPLDQWWALRSVFPKADNYAMLTGGTRLSGDAAEDYAVEFYQDNREPAPLRKIDAATYKARLLTLDDMLDADAVAQGGR